MIYLAAWGKMPPCQAASLEQPEIHFDAGLNSHRLAVLGSRLELPLLHGLDGLLIQAQPQRRDDFDLRGIAVCIHNQRQPDSALELRFASLFGILRLRREQQRRRGNAIADSQSAAHAAARSIANAVAA